MAQSLFAAFLCAAIALIFCSQPTIVQISPLTGPVSVAGLTCKLTSLDAFGVGVLIFVGLLFGIPYTRFILRKAEIPKWPSARATVVGASVGRGLPGTGYGYLLVLHTAISYEFEVEGLRYEGWFALGTGSPEDGADIAKKAQGMSLEVRYNPKKPKDSLPLETKILGRPVLLGESWLNPRVW